LNGLLSLILEYSADNVTECGSGQTVRFLSCFRLLNINKFTQDKHYIIFIAQQKKRYGQAMPSLTNLCCKGINDHKILVCVFFCRNSNLFLLIWLLWTY